MTLSPFSAHDRLRPLLLADTYDALFSQLDTDGDGFVSFEEFRLFLREARRPGDPEAALTEVLATASNDAMLRLLFTFLDNGGGGDITKESLAGSVRRSREVRSILRTHEFLRPLLDEQNINEAFDAIDVNRDGKLQFEEFAQFCNAACAREGGGAAVSPVDASRAPPASREAALKEALGTAEKERLVQLLFVYFDADRSGEISGEEVLNAIEGSRAVRNILDSQEFLRPLLDRATYEQTFKEIDTDGSGELSYEEFKVFCDLGFQRQQEAAAAAAAQQAS